MAHWVVHHLRYCQIAGRRGDYLLLSCIIGEYSVEFCVCLGGYETIDGGQNRLRCVDRMLDGF